MSEHKTVAILSSAAGGGAGIAAQRMANAINIVSKHSADFIDLSALGEASPSTVSPTGSYTNNSISDTHFSVEHTGYQRGWLLDMLCAYDLVNVHWASFLVSVGELLELALRGKKMLFMLHDYYYITGGCHYPSTCDQFGKGCTTCPQVDATRCDLSVIAKNYRVKQKIFAHENVHLAAPSAFLRNEAVNIGIVPQERAHVVRNPYHPMTELVADRPFARRILLIADSLHEGRKNMRFALEVLARLKEAGEDFLVDIVGKAPDEMRTYLKTADVKHVFHGRITDHELLVEIMGEVDLILTCSLEDNWPNILVEAGCYGCVPVVGPGHGCEEFVRAYNFGYVSADYSTEAFITTLQEALHEDHAIDRQEICTRIRSDHAPANIARNFSALMEEILNQ